MNEFQNIGKIGSCQANPRPCRVNAGRSCQKLSRLIENSGAKAKWSRPEVPAMRFRGVAAGAKRMEWIAHGPGLLSSTPMTTLRDAPSLAPPSPGCDLAPGDPTRMLLDSLGKLPCTSL